ncbi:MAG: mechanosensitive ion channel [Planctomycetota bacterium]
MGRQLLVLVLSFLAVCPVVSAQQPMSPSPQNAETTENEPISIDQLEDLANRLEDPERRKLLVEDLRALVELRRSESEKEESSAPVVADGISDFFRNVSDQARATVADLIEQLSRVPSALRGWWSELDDVEYRNELLTQLAIGGGIVLAAIVVGILAWLLSRRFHRRLVERSQGKARLAAKIWRPVLMTVIDAVPPVLVLVTGFSGVAILDPPPGTSRVVLAVVSAIAFKHLVVVLVRAFLAPDASEIRPLPMSDETAQRLDGWVRRIATLGFYGFYGLVAFDALGVEPLLIEALSRLLGLVLVVSGIAMILKHRDTAREALKKRLESKKDEGKGGWRSAALSLLNLWWILAILYLVGLFVIWASGVERGPTVVFRATGLTLLAVLAGLAVAALGRWLVGKVIGLMKPLRQQFPELGTSLSRYESGLRLLVNITVGVLSFCFVLEAWGLDGLSVLTSGTVRALFSVITTILVILFLAAATIDAATVLIQRYLESKEKRGRATAKTRTILPLAQKAIRTIVIVLAAIMVLSEAGVNIGPLLAGVGVLGLAIGFGAQALVKDIITGVFMLIEDTVAVGDVAVVNGTGGVVEAINIRTMRLRDLSANVHTIPYSEIGTITNMTKDFSRYLLEINITYREDTDEVVELLKELDEEMRNDDGFKRVITQPIEILGLDRFGDSAVVIRARLTTKPGEQWRTGREFNRRMKKLFDARGIEIPFPHRTIYWGELKDGSAPPLHVRSQQRPAEIEEEQEPAPEAKKEDPSRSSSNAPSAENVTEGDDPGSVGK